MTSLGEISANTSCVQVEGVDIVREGELFGFGFGSAAIYSLRLEGR